MKLYVQFDDHDGQGIKVTASSAAMRDAVRVYLTVLGGNDACLHLTAAHAKMLRAGLGEWLDDVSEGEA